MNPLTGRKVLIIAVASFAVVLAANLTMMFAATGTFPGLVVGNSYVASQDWDRKAAAQRALGWAAEVDYSGERLAVRITGADGEPVRGLTVSAVAGHPASDRADRALDLAEDVSGYVAPLDLEPGLWRIEISARDAAGAAFEAEARLNVKAPG